MSIAQLAAVIWQTPSAATETGMQAAVVLAVGIDISIAGGRS
jgi:hypothetical protein